MLVLASAVVVVGVASPRPAEACGPGFSIDLLLDRHRTLTSLPEGFFAQEVSELVAPPPLPSDEGPRAAARFELGQLARDLLDAGDDVGAVRLYAAQAAHHSPSGRASLLLVVRAITRDKARTTQLMNDEVGRHLLAVYLYTRPNELTDLRRDELYRELLEHAGPESGVMRGASRLAAVAYSRGEWGRAASLAEEEPSTLSTWVLAKLDLRKGDVSAAEARLEGIAGDLEGQGACPEDDPWHRWLHARIDAERAALRVAQGRFIDGLDLLARGRTLTDGGAYLAERVLTTDELIAFVEERMTSKAVTPDDHLRRLLARRLLREGRYEQAQRWAEPSRRPAVGELANAMTSAEEAGREDEPIERARHLFQASTLLRERGLELIGTVSAPDWASLDGDYSIYEDAGDVLGDDPMQTPVEVDRRQAHAPSPNDRWHYREVASRLAEQAAMLVPDRSQAFAALLCHAGRRVDETTRQRLYRLYIARGAAVPFATTFGDRCPPPEFDRAQDMADAQAREQRRQPWPVVALLALLPVALVMARRRAKTPVTPL